jgi:hypothetical protein
MSTTLIIVIAFIVILVVVMFFLVRSQMSRKLDILSNPITAPTYPLNKTVVGPKGQMSASSEEHKLVCITEGVNAKVIEKAPQTREGTAIIGGDTPSEVYWKGGKWELQIHLSLYNNSLSNILVYDFHTHVYHISAMGPFPPLDLAYSPRIELAQDNSILSQGIRFRLAPCEFQPVDLVLETSLFDTIATSLVFGIFVDYEIPSVNDVKKCRIPSNDIYLFLHDHRWGVTRCEFAAENPNMIAVQAEKNSSFNELWSSLQEIHTKHAAEGLLFLA